MKSIKIFATVGAIALLGMTGLTSCNQKNTPVGPENYNGETVKAEFSIALPSEAAGDNSVRRMPAATVQAEGRSQFQGMTGIVLVPFAKQSAITGSDTRLGANIPLSDISAASELGTTNNAKCYTNVTIPLSTGSFLFYAKSKATGTAFQVGELTMTNETNNNPSAFEFSLSKIHTASTTTGTETGKKLLDYLNHIAEAEDGAGTPKHWYEHTDNAALEAMFATYSSMKGLSSFNVARILSNLYTSLHPLYGSNTLAKNICDAIANADNAFDDVVDAVTETPASSGKYVVTLKTAYNNFPTKYNLPEGCIYIKWDSSTKKFRECTSDEYGSANIALPSVYTFPAQLWYYANSTVVTSNTSKKDMYTSTTPTYDWGQILTAHSDAVSVNSLTRAVAIHDTIQYAVARLDVTVQLAATTLPDNSESATGIAVDVTPNVSGFPVSAVIVGGQRKVGYNFEVKTPSDPAEYTIYDNVMTNTINAVYGSASAVNHTLVLQSKEDEDVKVAIELTNNTGVDFYGVANQLIPAGGKFYVVGTLPHSLAVKTEGCVFKQDYRTIANFTLDNLGKAYNTIPDLRTPQLELGFSVNLSWKNGDVYDVTIE